jgi:RNA polymerase-binding transcription factor DksA
MIAEQKAPVPSVHLGRRRLAQFRDALLEQRAGLVQRIGGENEDVAVDRSVSEAAFARATEHLEEVDAALRRVDDGTYGSCETCQRAIPLERLEIVPAAARCVDCQSRSASLLG